jgi:hypothetical protein
MSHYQQLIILWIVALLALAIAAFLYMNVLRPNRWHAWSLVVCIPLAVIVTIVSSRSFGLGIGLAGGVLFFALLIAMSGYDAAVSQQIKSWLAAPPERKFDDKAPLWSVRLWIPRRTAEQFKAAGRRSTLFKVKLSAWALLQGAGLVVLACFAVGILSSTVFLIVSLCLGATAVIGQFVLWKTD